MDPNEVLADLRARCDAVEASFSEEVHLAARPLVDSFRALDEWISRGGFLPKDWTWGQHPDTGMVVERAVQSFIDKHKRSTPRSKED